MSSSRAIDLRWLILMIVSGIIVQLPYCQFPWQDDERRHFAAIDRIDRGELRTEAWLLEPYNEHRIIAWKLLVYAQYQCFGTYRPAWQISLIALTVISSWTLFQLMQLAGASKRAAGIAGLVVSSAALPSIDSPNGWFAVSHLNLGLLFWLLAWKQAVQASRACETNQEASNSSPASPQQARNTGRHLWVMLGWLTLMLLSMHALILLTPGIIVFWLAHRALRQHPGIRALLTWWLLATIIIALIPKPVNPDVKQYSVSNAIGLTNRQFAAAFCDLLIPSSLTMPALTLSHTYELLIGLLSSALVLGGVSALAMIYRPGPKRVWTLVTCMLIGCLIYQAGSCYFRSGWSLTVAGGWSRLRYPMHTVAAMVIGMALAARGSKSSDRSDDDSRDKPTKFDVLVLAGVVLVQHWAAVKVVAIWRAFLANV